MRPFKPDDKLLTWASPTQRKYYEAIKKYGSIRAASRELNVCFTTIHGCMTSLQSRAAMAGYAPDNDMQHPVPSPFIVRGTSTLYDEDGKAKLQWVKTKLDESKVEAVIREFVASMVQEAKGLSKLIAPPKLAAEDLMVVYPIGDPHFGMYAWAAEAGEDFDTEIAEKITTGAIDRLVAASPSSSTALILPLGDLMHADDSKNRTPQSGNILDVDTRHQRVMRVALRAIKHCIYRALEKHKLVVVRIVRGNHDPHASFAIALALSEFFHNNDRVKVDLSPADFWYHRFGKVLVGVTHGDTVKANDLLGVMASDRPEDWGQTKFRYFYHGHVHNSGVKELPGLLIEWFRTLAPRDAWTSSAGYRAGRDMYAIVLHKDYGEIERHRCDIAMLEAA